MRELFRKLNQVISSGQDAVLVTIVASSGSTPRGSGARMLVTKEGRVAGTIGGGSVEFESMKLALKCLESRGSARESFHLTHNEVADIGMICGGDVDVSFRFIAAGDDYFIRLTEAIDGLYERGIHSWLITQITDDNNGNISVYSASDGVIGEDIPTDLLNRLANKPAQVETGNGIYHIETLVQAGRVFVFGGGHVSQQLVPLLAKCGFRCIVLEDRIEFTAPELFENAASDIRLMDMDKVADLISEITEDDYICIMTRGHKDDYLVQYQMLKTAACYIGVIGSRHKIAGVNARLRADGYTDEDLRRITTPIGIDILAETPEEIAVSVVAQLIKVRAERNGSRKIKNPETN